jgi:ERCC4-type nuclease
MALLDVKVLLVEGRPRWSNSGHLLDVPVRIHRTALRGVLWSAQQRGMWVVQTVDVSDTVDALVHLRSWVAKRRHVAFDRMRPSQAEVGSRAWGVQLLQSFPLVGPVVAGAIWDHFGRAPLRWDVEAEDLASERGVGPVRAAQLLLSLSTSTVEVPAGGAGSPEAA